MHKKNHKEVVLINHLKSVLTKQDLKQHQAFILNLAEQLDVSVLEIAAALLAHNKVSIPAYQNNRESAAEEKSKKAEESESIPLPQTKQKRVRYRLEIGRKHQILLDEVKDTLVEIAGVDRNQIGRIDVRNHYTLVELPYGMPADIFQLLSETELHNQKLNIKRVKQHRRYNQQKKSRK